MWKYKVTMPASVLASVLVISTLIFMGVFFVMLLFDSELLLFSDCYRQGQEKAWLNSAVVRYCQDSTLHTGISTDTTLMLFPEERNSKVSIRSYRWGLYEILEITAGRYTARRLLGKAAESFYEAAMYVPERQRMLSVAGKTQLKGKLYLGAKGITYVRMREDFYKATLLDMSQIYRSKEEFPEVGQEVEALVSNLMANGLKELPPAEREGEVSFSHPIVYRQLEPDVGEMDLSGHFVLYAGDTLCIRENNRFRGVIAVARKVRITQGFKGSLQIFARDSIILEKQVILLPGSGLWVNGELSGRSIRLGENCVINGYVVVRGNRLTSERPVPHYFQSPGSLVKGLVYIDGTAHIQGSIEGCLYAREFCYFAPEGYYSDLLCDVMLRRNGAAVYPFLLKGPTERREVR